MPRGLQFCGFTPLSQCICSLVFLVVFLFLVYVCYSFLAFSAPSFHKFFFLRFHGSLKGLVGLLTLRLPSLGWVFLASSLSLRFSFLPWTFISSLFACCHSRAGILFVFSHAVFWYSLKDLLTQLSASISSLVVSLYSQFMSAFVPPFHL